MQKAARDNNLPNRNHQTTHERVEAAVPGELAIEVSRGLGVGQPERPGAGARGLGGGPAAAAGGGEGRDGAALGEGGLHFFKVLGGCAGEKGKGRRERGRTVKVKQS